MVNINLAGIPVEFDTTGKAMIEALHKVDIGAEATAVVETYNPLEPAGLVKLGHMAMEDAPKFIPQMLQNDFVMADNVARVGKGVSDCAKAIVKIDKKVGLAVVLGVTACIGVGYLYGMCKDQQKEIQDLKKRNNYEPDTTANARIVGFGEMK